MCLPICSQFCPKYANALSIFVTFTNYFQLIADGGYWVYETGWRLGFKTNGNIQLYILTGHFWNFYRTEMLKFHPYSILTGETMVGFVIYCVLRSTKEQHIKTQHCVLDIYFLYVQFNLWMMALFKDGWMRRAKEELRSRRVKVFYQFFLQCQSKLWKQTFPILDWHNGAKSFWKLI